MSQVLETTGSYLQIAVLSRLTVARFTLKSSSSMKFAISLTEVERMKDAVRASLPDVKSSHRVEALARGLGWNTNVALRRRCRCARGSQSRRSCLPSLSAGTFLRRAGWHLGACVRQGRHPAAMDIEPSLSSFGYKVFRERQETVGGSRSAIPREPCRQRQASHDPE